MHHKNHDRRTRQSRRSVYVCAKNSRNLGQQHIPDGSAAHTGNAAHKNSNKRVDVISQCLARPRNREQGQPAGVQAKNQWVRNLPDEMMEQEDDAAPEEGNRAQTPVANRTWRDGANQHYRE